MTEEIEQITALLKGLRLFEGLDDDQLAQVAGVMTLVSLQEGQELALPEERDVPFYVIAEGKISQAWMRRTGEQVLTLKKGDFFGADVLFLGSERFYGITARTPVKLLAVEADQLRPLVKSLPPLQANLKKALYIYSLVRKKSFEWLDEEETVYLVVRKHIDFLLITLIGPLALLTLGLVVMLLSVPIGAPGVRVLVLAVGALISLAALLWTAWAYFDWSNDYYIVTDQRVVWLEHVLALYDSRQEAPLVAVKSEETSSTFLGRLLGYGNVVINAFMGQVIFRHIAEPVVVRELIDELRRRAMSQQSSSDTRMMEGMIRRKIDPPLPAEPASAAAAASVPAARTSILPRFLRLGGGGTRQKIVDYFRFRLEENGVITYRKHALVLLAKIGLPTLTSLAVIALSFWTSWRSIAGLISFPSPLTSILLGLLLMLFPALWWLYQYVDWRNDLYRITAEQIVDSEKKPLGDELTKSAPLENIISLDYERKGLLGILFNFGSVYINVGTEVRLSWDNIHDPARAQRDIYRAMYAFRRKKQMSESTREWERVSDWLAAYHRQAEDLRRSRPPSD